MAGKDWAARVVAGMRERTEKERAAEAAREAELDAADAVKPTRAEQEQARREARERAERERAERIAASVQAARERRVKAWRPMSDYDRQVAAQALGPQWDHYDGPGAA